MIRGGKETAGDGLPWPTGPQAVLLQAAIGPVAGAEAAFRAWCDMVDLDDHVDGGTFRLLPLVFERLHTMKVDHPLMGRLKGVYRMAWYENHHLFHDVAPVVAALEAAGVRTMLLKGAPLSLTYYKSHATRPMLDLDLAVPTAQAGEALAVLDGLGWSVGSRVKAYEMPESHAVDLRNLAGRELDLHWHCLRETPSPAANAWFWDTARPFVFCGVTTLQPAPTTMLLQTVMHGVRSNEEPPIRWIVDAAVLIEAAGDAIDWDELVRFARSQRLCHRLFLGLHYLKTTYGVAVPDPVLAQLKAAGVSLVERIENIVYLGDSQQMYRPRLYPLVDYWRFLRSEKPLAFAKGFLAYLQRRWRLKSPLQVPAEMAAMLLRRLAPRRSRA